MKKNSIFKLLLLLSIVFVSCTKEETIVQNIFEVIDSNIIVSSEGNFGAKDGSVSYFGKNNSDVFYYEKENGAKVAGLIQSICFGEEYAYIILNDVNQIIVVDKYTFKQEQIIQTGLGNPRYMAIVGNKGYITNWGVTGDESSDDYDDYIAVLNLNTNTIEDTKITEGLPFGPEQIVAIGDKLYVSHKGANSSNNKISIIDSTTDIIVSNIEVDYNPDELIIDGSGNLIILCEGTPDYSNWPTVTAINQSSITFISTVDDSITKKINFKETERATLMSYEDGNIYYYQGDKVFIVQDNANAITASNGISVGSIYGMNVKGNHLFTVSYAFTSLSKLNVINISNSETEFSSAVGLGASKIYFTE